MQVWSAVAPCCRLALPLLGVGLAWLPAQGPTWFRPRLPTPTQDSGLAYDLVRQRTVSVGMDTREWDGSQWVPRVTTPVLAPSGAMTYDAVRRRTVLLFGRSTWEWDGMVWVERPFTLGPDARRQRAMVHDFSRQRLVLFGGSEAQIDGVTWEFDGGAWQQRASTGPTPRFRHAMAYDATRGRVVLFGGHDGQAELGDTWEWDGVAWMSPATGIAPGPRLGQALTYDPFRRHVLLHGGVAQYRALADTWTWNGSAWTQLAAGGGPAAPGTMAMVYDVARRRAVLTIAGDDTLAVWEHDGVRWSLRSEVGEPGSRVDARMVFDDTRRRAVLFGGLDRYGRPGGLWEWDGLAWHHRAEPGGPGSVGSHAMAFDAARGQVVVFGGAMGPSVTWLWDGRAWTQGAGGPSARHWSAMASDPLRQRVVLFGGNDATGLLGDTWEWDGTAWTQRGPANAPSPRVGAAMAWDPVRQRVVLFGGVFHRYQAGIFTVVDRDDTWEWDGVNWLQRRPAVTPLGRSRHGMAWDGARQRVVMAGGYQSYGGKHISTHALPDAWEWDGVGWTSVPAAASAGSMAMAWDAVRQRLVTVGDQGTWLRGMHAPAAAVTHGAGCGSAGRVPQLQGNAPLLGGPVLLDLLTAMPGAPCLIGVAASSRSVMLPGGCTLLIDSPLASVLVSSSVFGTATARFLVPEAPGLRGLTLFAQGAVLDPGTPLGVGLSGGLRLVLGE